MDKISVNKLVEEVKSNLPREIIVSIAQSCLNEKKDSQTTIKKFENEVYKYTLKVQKKVINCTGTLLHTNLGRAQTDIDFNGESTNVEYDILNNRRGVRNEFLNESMNLLLGSEDVCFVNNNASSLYVTLKTLKNIYGKKSIIISRGEIIEIGGSYRLPEIIQETGLKMVEVGTTNKTKITDYKKALKDNKDSLILKVHRSNFSIDGFVEEVNLKDLKSLTDEENSILIHDLGSGLVASRKFLEKENIDIFDDEPTVQESLIQGADLVMFSGDKLFGSLQSGVIAGDKKIIQSIKESPLFRTYRCSPLTLFELQETTNRYVSKKEIEIPLWKMIAMKYEDLENRIKSVSENLEIKHEVVNDNSVMGGGTLPNKSISTPVIQISEIENPDLISKLMGNEVPIIPRINKNNIIIDLRSTSEKNDIYIKDFFTKL
ncbi:L-seryl-tRNA(Sec) selenium transferase [Acidimicrobiaceae bacterium]|nr:L-seryl-tRNA(Sec) selenium transferase [Acidimicrobiaceae bacterium]